MTDQPLEPLRPPSVLGLIRRRWYAIVLPLVVVGAAGFGLSQLQDKEYEAEASLLFRDSGTDSPVLASQDPTREAATNVRLLQLDILDQLVEARLGRPFSAEVDVVAEADSNLATITVTAASPRLAARLANLYAEEYIALRRKTTRREIEQGRATVREELNDLTAREAKGPRGLALRQRDRELALAAVAPSGTRLVSQAQPPSSASSPVPLRNTAIGALIGLALGVTAAIGLERRDRRVRDPRQIEAVFERPIVGKIPRSRTLAKTGPGTEELPPPEAEAFRALRANLGHLLEERDARSILVTSANPEEGKTTVAWNLARSAALSGEQVLLVEADMRRPVLADSLGKDGADGLSELLAGSGKLTDLITRVDFEGVADSPSAAADVLLAGQVPADPSELLDSGKMKAVLEAVPDSYDLIIVDTPPAAVVSDAVPILELVDGVLVVGRLGMTTYDAIVELRDRLATLQAQVIGVVVNADVPNTSAYGYYYQAAVRD